MRRKPHPGNADKQLFPVRRVSARKQSVPVGETIFNRCLRMMSIGSLHFATGKRRVFSPRPQRLLFSAIYVALLVWFKQVDVFHRQFSESGLVVFGYNCFRLLFIFYLFWMIEAVGLLTLRLIARKEVAETGVLERLALGFFTGAGIWHSALLALGYLDLYTVPVAIVIT